MIKERLSEAPGWIELDEMVRTRRADRQKPVPWLQTLSHGKEILESFKHFLADRAYVSKALKDFLPVERADVEKRMYTKMVAVPDYTLETAQNDLMNLKWENFKKLVESVLINSTRVYRAYGYT